MMQQAPNTSDLCSSLFWHLADKGLAPAEINRLVKDLFCILQHGGTFTVGVINHQLNEMGWSGRPIDEASIEIVLSILKQEFEYNISTHSVH